MHRIFLAAALLLSSSAWAQAPLGYGRVSTAVEGSRILKTTGGKLYDFQVNTGGVAVWVLLFDSPTVPADGAVLPVKWWQVAINSTLGVSWFGDGPLLLNTGITLVCSSTGPFTKTVTSTCTFSGETQ